MNSNFTKLLAKMASNGWTVKTELTKRPLPVDISERYHWAPDDILDFLCLYSTVATNDDRTWFVTNAEIRDESGSEFAWNQWEIDSIEAAKDDREWCRNIVSFWDSHMPLIISVRNAYKYVAIRESDLSIVGGIEPEFEETSLVAEDFEMLLNKLSGGDQLEYT